MKRILSLLLVLVLAVGMFAACSSDTQQQDTEQPGDTEQPEENGDEAVVNDGEEVQETNGVLIVGLDDHFPPMGYRDEANNLAGFDIDLALEVGARLNMEVRLEPINWSVKELELNNGNVHLLWNGLTITEERQESMLISPAYLRNAQVVLVQADSDINAIADLAGKEVAYQNGSSAFTAIENPENGLLDIVKTTTGYEDNVNALNDLEFGRVDALVVDKVVADYYMAKKEGVYKMLEEQLAEEEFGVAFKKGDEELYEKVCQAFADMVEDGTAERISVEWFGEDKIIFEY